MNFGIKVRVVLKDPELPETIIRNVTEIHYGYDSPLPNRIAFESDIHHTGCTYDFDEIKEFETSLEEEKAKEF